MLRLLHCWAERVDLDTIDAIDGFCVEYLSQIESERAIEQLLRLPSARDRSDSESSSSIGENATLSASLSQILHRLHDYCRCKSESRLLKIEALISGVFFALLNSFLRFKAEFRSREAVLLLEMLMHFSSGILLHEGFCFILYTNDLHYQANKSSHFFFCLSRYNHRCPAH